VASYVEVPADKLSEDALEALVEDFITREGTDYGAVEHSLTQKKSAVRSQLMRGDAVIVFDLRTESVTLTLRRELAQLARESEHDLEP